MNTQLEVHLLVAKFRCTAWLESRGPGGPVGGVGAGFYGDILE